MPPAARRILIVTDAWQPQVNGVVRTYEHLAAELERLGHTVRVIGPHDFPFRMPMPGYREIELALLPGLRLARLTGDFRPDLIHIGTEGPLGRAAARYCRRRGIRFTTAYHTQFPAYLARRVGRVMPLLAGPAERLADASLRRFHRAAAAVITTTPSLDAELRTRGYDMHLISLPRGVPVEQFTPGGSSLFPDLPRPIALYVGRVAIEKNIEAFLGMGWAGSKVVVGDGPGLETLRVRYPAIIFAGKQTGAALADHYRAADIFVFPSKTDTFGIVLIEALASGLPVAAYPVTGPRDIVTTPLLGCLNDDLAIAARGALTMADKKIERHQYIADHYAWPVIAKRFLDILEEASH